MKKKIAGALIALFALTLAACGKSGGTETNVKEHVYKAEEITLNELEDKMSLNKMFVRGEKMYLVGNIWEENGSTTYIVTRNTDGSETATVTVKKEENQSLDYLTADDAGNYYAVFSEYFEDDSDPDNYIWENKFYLLKLDAAGKELWKQPLVNDDPSMEYYGASFMDILKDGRIIVVDDNGITFFDTAGRQLKKVIPEEPFAGSGIWQLQNGSIAVDYYNPDTGKNSLRILDVETGRFTEEYTIPGQSGNYSYYPGNGWDLLLMGSTGVYGYNLGDTEVTELMNIIDSDLSVSYIYNIVAIDSNSFYGLTDDNMTKETVLMRFTKVAPEDVVDKKVMTLGCNGLDWDVRMQVVAYNKKNEQYRITIKDYSEYNTDEDYEAGMTKLNTDIASGNAPDILALQNGMPIDSFVAKGLFEDLYPYIEKDEELKREDFFANVLKAYETDGKLYRMVPEFVILTVTGKTADVGEKPGWSMEQLNAVMAKKPSGTQVFSGVTRRDILNYFIQMSGNQFVDWETGECTFHSDAFIQFLEFMKQFPEQIDESGYDDSFWQDYEMQWRNGSTLLNVTYLDGFNTWNYMRKGTFGEDITMIGFPADNGNGAVIMPNLDLTISSRSKNKEGAWQFLRYFMTREYQDQVSYGWPLCLSSLEKLKEEAQKRQSYEDENGNTVMYDPEYTLGDITIPITPITAEEADTIISYVSSVEQVYSYDENLVNIINEEAAPFFAGQKSAKDSADIIQSRVQIYVNENR